MPFSSPSDLPGTEPAADVAHSQTEYHHNPHDQFQSTRPCGARRFYYNSLCILFLGGDERGGSQSGVLFAWTAAHHGYNPL